MSKAKSVSKEKATKICPYCDGAGWTINDRFSADTNCYDCDSTGKVTQEVWQKYYDWVKDMHSKSSPGGIGTPITEWLKYPR